MNWYLAVLKKYAVFEGRAQRKEYWMFVLFNLIIGLVLGVVEGLAGIASQTDQSVLAAIYSLAIFIPALAVSVRRLHDTNRTGWWMLMCFIPLIGFIVLLIFMVQDSNPGSNDYGANPKETAATTV